MDHHQRIGDKGLKIICRGMRLGLSASTMSGEKKYYLTNLPAKTGLFVLAATIKARWVCRSRRISS